MKTHYIYKLIFPNNKVYIGQTCNFVSRMNSHKNDSKNTKKKGYNLPLYCAIRKFGFENIEKHVLCECSSNEVDELEKKFIIENNSHCNKFGYNIDLGGHKLKTVSERTRKLMSIAAKKRKPRTKSVQQIDRVTGKIIKIWDSMTEAGNFLGVPITIISNMCNNTTRKRKINGKTYYSKPRHAYGYIWKFNNIT